MDNSLAYIQNPDIGPGQNAGNGRGQAGAIRAGNVDQDDFLQGVAPVRKRNPPF